MELQSTTLIPTGEGRTASRRPAGSGGRLSFPVIEELSRSVRAGNLGPWMPFLEPIEKRPGLVHDYLLPQAWDKPQAIALLVVSNQQITRDFQETSSTSWAQLPTDRELLKQRIYSLLEDAGHGNWDGEGALALDPGTVEFAQCLADQLPADVPAPEIAATPHGEVDFDWVFDSDLMLTVSVGPSGEIAFAGYFHGAKLNGEEPWTGSLPGFVKCCLERLRDASRT